MAINDDIHHTDMNWVGILCYQISPPGAISLSAQHLRE